MEITYKNIKIKSFKNSASIYFYATSKLGSSFNEYSSELKNFCHGFKTAEEAVENVKTKIDKFFNIVPKSYNELAGFIQEYLVWTGYEDCEIDEEILEYLVESFIKNK